jgi:hypothetical protein
VTTVGRHGDDALAGPIQSNDRSRAAAAGAIPERNLLCPSRGSCWYFPILNGSTTKFERPYAMDLPRDEVVSVQGTLQIHVRRLKYLTDEKTLPDSQLWGFRQGVLD